ncbi:4'-phosphopantetheinyl transferase family protein [Prochlorococcus marinus]|uniref:4'-phosphopantetheinyl transferase family protein n=1 Tax=Prochlorococcus marinus TaxID=1219 RepID=UPI0022B30C39|nr:4'-phosphopantetheinyl transferase superfamily protein [Prochlorococcus marinus]
MLFHQLEETLPLTEVLNSRVLPLWLIPIESTAQEITPEETKIANSLSTKRSKEYKITRGYARLILSKLFNIDPLKVPLKAYPGKAPSLPEGFGYISFSHCRDALLIAWSPEQVGVDIENKNRKFSRKLIASRFYTDKENNALIQLENSFYDLEVLNIWVMKEALIKWQRGRLSKDLGEWEIERKTNIAIHKKLNHHVNVYLKSYKNWTISTASNQKIYKTQPMLCTF